MFKEIEEEKRLKLKSIGKPFNDGILIPKTELTDTYEKVKHRFENVGKGLVIRTVKNSMQEGYWFVKLCEDAAPSL